MAKGQKTGGRTKGTPNKKKTQEVEEVKTIFKRGGGFDRIMDLIELMIEEGQIKDATTSMLKVAEFAYPKLKSVEMKAQIEDDREDRSIEEIEKELQQLKKLDD